jgi:serine protease
MNIVQHIILLSNRWTCSIGIVIWPNQSIFSGNWEYYTFKVPSSASTLTFEVNGGKGDTDLYIRHGANPTLSNFDCRSWNYGNSESCKELRPASGTWHIGVYAYPGSDNVSGLTVTAQQE